MRPVERVCALHGEAGVSARGQHIELGHRARGCLKLGADGLFGAAALPHIAVDAAAEAELVRRVHVDAEVIQRWKLRIVQREDAFDDDKALGRDGIE
jgi:hypothetical protein